MAGLRIKGAIAAFAMVITAVGAVPLRAETLADALISAYRHSNLLEQNRALLRAADEDVAASVAALRPIINFVATAGYRYTDVGRGIQSEGTNSSYGLTAEITLFDSGRNQLAIEAAKETVLATRESLVGIEQQVLLGAVNAFFNVRSAGEFVALRQSNVRVITQELRAANDRFEVGEVTRTDVAIAQARLAAARANLSSAEGDLMVAREAYKAATGHYPGQLSQPPRVPKTAANLEKAKEIAVRNHPNVLKAKHDARAAEFNVARAKAGMGPSLNLGGSVKVNDGGEEDRALNLTFTQPIYQGGRLSALHRRAIAVHQAQMSALHQSGVEVARLTGDAWAQLAVAYAALEAGDQQIRAARTAYEGVREEAKLGSRTTLDVLNAEQELLDAQASRISADARRHIAVYSLLASMGLLTADHLKLGIPTYDPSAYYNAVKNAPATSPQGKRLDRILKTIGKN